MILKPAQSLNYEQKYHPLHTMITSNQKPSPTELLNIFKFNMLNIDAD